MAISNYIEMPNVFEQGELVCVKVEDLFRINNVIDVEIVDRFNDFHCHKRSLRNSLSSECSIDINKTKGSEFEIVLKKLSGMSDTFIAKWDTIEVSFLESKSVALVSKSSYYHDGDS